MGLFQNGADRQHGNSCKPEDLVPAHFETDLGSFGPAETKLNYHARAKPAKSRRN